MYHKRSLWLMFIQDLMKDPNKQSPNYSHFRALHNKFWWRRPCVYHHTKFGHPIGKGSDRVISSLLMATRAESSLVMNKTVGKANQFSCMFNFYSVRMVNCHSLHNMYVNPEVQFSNCLDWPSINFAWSTSLKGVYWQVKYRSCTFL